MRMREFNIIVRDLVHSRQIDVSLAKLYPTDDVRQLMDFIVKPYLSGEIDVTANMTDEEKQKWNVDAIKWNVVNTLKEIYGVRDYCPHCYAKNPEILDVIDRVTMPTAIAARCKDCDKRYGWNVGY